SSSDAQTSRTRHLARSTVIVMVAFGLAKVISLAQTFIIARVFGVGAEWDAFVTANRIPELIFTLIAGGALAHAFIPIFSGYLAREDHAGGWRVASQVINFIFGVTFIASVIAYFAAPWLIANFVAPGFTAEAQATTVGLMRVLLISTLIFSVSGIVMGILQSFNHFLLPAVAPMMFDVGILIGVLFFLPAFGVYGIAYGAVLGAALHLGVQIPGLIRFRARWTPSLGLRNPVLWRVIRLMLPRVAGLGVFSVNFIVMNNIASRLGTGSVSALDWGWRLMQIPQTLIGTAMGTVIFPTLAQLSALGDENGKRANMTGALKFIMIGSIPSSLGLIFVGRPLISLLEGGQFDASASDLVYSTLQFFALGLIVHSVLEVIARSFYADGDTLTPLWAALGGAAINLVLSFTLSGVTQAESALSAYGVIAATAPGFLAPRPDFGFVGGLALANSLGVMFEVVFLMFILRKRWHGINENALATTTLKTLAASLVMTVAIVAVDLLWVALDLEARGRMLLIVEIAVQVVVGILVFVGMAALLRMEELRALLNLVLRRRSEAAA
ncbi:MAG TPA: murein biosynthesis integral membrane protein MurJ, partial [Aggregatilineales bacterium]|nr:murein biosynthesis integral membrane protein MurJ [Aggregatilineales bacterium]